ncbi:MAG: hypothetical protein FWG63_00815 [Defluviitaleaceae bacterium]|nr:hypothetical protein [Defluviitaleaceae bacterium]
MNLKDLPVEGLLSPDMLNAKSCQCKDGCGCGCDNAAAGAGGAVENGKLVYDISEMPETPETPETPEMLEMPEMPEMIPMEPMKPMKSASEYAQSGYRCGCNGGMGAGINSNTMHINRYVGKTG